MKFGGTARDAKGWFATTTSASLHELAVANGMLTLEGWAEPYREEHGVDVQGEFDEVVEVVGFPQLRVGRHGCASAHG